MANSVVGTIAEIELLDGTKLTIRPNPIARQRKFMKRITDGPEKDDEQGFDMTMDLVIISLGKDYAELVEDREALEDNIDEPTAVKILEVCGGVKMNDPKQVEAAIAALEAKEAQEKTGTN